MRKQKLTTNDKDRIRSEINYASRFLLILFIVLMSSIFLIIMVMYLFFDIVPVDGLLPRILKFAGLTLILFLFLSHTQILMRIDIKLNQKVIFETSNYVLKNTKDGKVIKIISPIKRELYVYDELISLVKLDKPIQVEITKHSKFLLAVSQNGTNLIEIMGKDWEEFNDVNNR